MRFPLLRLFVLYTLASVLIPSTAKADIIVQSGAKYQCVVYAHIMTGNPLIHGIARNIPVNSHTPQVGAVVKTRESSLGHVAIVVAIQNNYLILAEANYDWHGTVTIGRKLAINSPKIVGYITN